VLHALPISSSLTLSFLAKSTSYEAPHYAVFSNLLSIYLTSVHIFSSAPCSQTPSVYVPPLMSETKFHTHTEPLQKIMVLYILIFTFLDSRREARRFWTEQSRTLPEFNLLLLSSRIKCSFVTVVANYSNCVTFSNYEYLFFNSFSLILITFKNNSFNDLNILVSISNATINSLRYATSRKVAGSRPDEVDFF
jgi:hypothetical protein